MFVSLYSGIQDGRHIIHIRMEGMRWSNIKMAILLTKTTTHITHRGCIEQTTAHNGHSAFGLDSMFAWTYCMCDKLRQMQIDLLIDFKAGHSVLLFTELSSQQVLIRTDYISDRPTQQTQITSKLFYCLNYFIWIISPYFEPVLYTHNSSTCL